MNKFYRGRALLASVIILAVFVLLLDIYLFREDTLMFWLTLPVLIAVSGLAVGKLFQIRQNEINYFEKLKGAIDSTNSVALGSFPLPAAHINEERRIIWCNNAFGECFYTPDDENSSIDGITEEPLEMFSDAGGREIEYGGRIYRVYARKPEIEPDDQTARSAEVLESVGSITMLFFDDITEYRALQEDYTVSRPVVMIIMVDNYDELLSGSKESERSEITSRIDRMVEEYFAEKNAVLRKFSGERFVVVLEERYVRQMIEDKIKLLEMARTVRIKDRPTPVTLSIGVGRTSGTLAENERLAFEALDNALKRGGDQAVIKTNDGTEFIGATTQGSERYSRVRARVMAEDIKKMVRSSDAVYIMGHSYGDYDSVGSAIGLAGAVRRMEVPAYAVVNTGANAAKLLIERFGNYADPIIIEPADARERFTQSSLLIIVDTHTIKKLDDKELFEKANPGRLVVIDHHRQSAGAITDALTWQEPNASSAAELVTELIQYFGVVPVFSEAKEAEGLLAGIMLDTKDFVMRTGVSTFEAAAFLRKHGADTISVKKLFDTSRESKMRKAEIVKDADLYRSFAISVVKESFPDVRVICSQAADEMLYISGVDASFTVYPIGERAWSFSARSLGKVNVQRIMEKMGNQKDDGGGHQTMAGAQLYEIDCEEAVNKLREAIDSYYDEIMSSNS